MGRMEEWGEDSAMINKNEKGIALVTVLLSLSFIFVVAASVASTGAVTTKLAYSGARSHRSLYLAESELTRTMWNVHYDIRQHSNRSLGFLAELGPDDDPDEERFFADGRAKVYTLDNKTVSVVIDDANKGFDFSGNMTASKISQISKLINLPEEADKEPLQLFMDKLIDYTDTNDLHRELGAEKDQYSEEGGYDLPRNAPIQFAEEILWIPGIEAALFAERDYQLENPEDGQVEETPYNFNVSDYLKIVPYKGKRISSTKPNFFASTDYHIKLLANLEVDELEEVKEARRAWYEESINIKESIPELYPRLTSKFTFTESKVYRIRIQVTDSNGLSVNTETIIDIDRTLPRYLENRFSGFKYWRKVNF
jgi:hypothetical protein